MVVGMIMPYGGPVTGDLGMQLQAQGWLPCDGAAISRVEFPELFRAIGVSWGVGDNATTFNVPDLRGYFMRGVDHGAGHDPGAAARVALPTRGSSGDSVGSYQSDSIPSTAAGGAGAANVYVEFLICYLSQMPVHPFRGPGSSDAGQP